MARPSPPRGVRRCASISTATRRSQPIAGGALDSSRPTLDAADGNQSGGVPGAGRRARRRGRRAAPGRPRPPSVLRGARPAVRGARDRRAGHRLVRPDRARRRPRRGVRAHAARRRRRPGAGSPPTSPPGSGTCGSTGAARRPASRPRSSRSASAWAGGCRSWPATLGLDLAGVDRVLRHARRAVAERRAGAGGRGRRRSRHPCSGCSAAPTGRSRPEAIAAFDAALTAPGTAHRLVSYEGAPHSFFDRKAAEFADASAAAWAETLAFIADPEAAVASSRADDRRSFRSVAPIPAGRAPGRSGLAGRRAPRAGGRRARKPGSRRPRPVQR